MVRLHFKMSDPRLSLSAPPANEVFITREQKIGYINHTFGVLILAGRQPKLDRDLNPFFRPDGNHGLHLQDDEGPAAPEQPGLPLLAADAGGRPRIHHLSHDRAPPPSSLDLGRLSPPTDSLASIMLPYKLL